MEDADKQLLLELARETIYAELDKEEPFLKPYTHLKQDQGCFVTLYKGKELRGCIGFTEPIYPLYKQVSEAAKAAAFGDPRFPAVRKEEVPKLTIEISLLTVPEIIAVDKPEDYIHHVTIGKDGLILKGKFGSGLLLPQVALDNNMTAKQFLNAVSQKAGLSFNAWQESGIKLFKFQAEIFKEDI